MLRWTRHAVLLLSLVVGLSSVVAARAEAAAAKAACIVCRVKQGEAGVEPVKATRERDGKSYAFCSEKCAHEFDADPAAFVPPTLPREAPAFALTDLDGKPITPESLAGSVVLLDFWATWCAPCRKSMPALQALHEKYAAKGFRVVGISIDEDGREKVKKFIAAKRITYPIALDVARDAAWAAFHVKTVPAAFLLDRDGRIVAQWTGAAADAAEVEAKLAGLLGGD